MRERERGTQRNPALCGMAFSACHGEFSVRANTGLTHGIARDGRHEHDCDCVEVKELSHELSCRRDSVRLDQGLTHWITIPNPTA